jgi:hypothetical protein
MEMFHSALSPSFVSLYEHDLEVSSDINDVTSVRYSNDKLNITILIQSSDFRTEILGAVVHRVFPPCLSRCHGASTCLRKEI